MQTYEITELVPPLLPPLSVQGADSGVNVYGLNASGAAAGWAHSETLQGEAILWGEPESPFVIETSDSAQDKPTPAGANGINDAGAIAGSMFVLPDTTAVSRAFIYPGTFWDLGPIVGGGSSAALDINNAGLVVGSAGGTKLNSPMHAFAFDSSSDSLTQIDPLPGDTAAQAQAANELGHIVGFSAKDRAGLDTRLFLYRDGASEGLGDGLSSGADINDSDVITGWRVFPSAQVQSAFRCQPDAIESGFEDLGPSLPTGFAGSAGEGINNDDVVVGWALDGNTNSHAMINFPTGADAGWHDLNDLLVEPDDWYLGVATAINDAGQVVGIGTHHGLHRSFLLTPLTAHLGDNRIAQVLLGAILMFGGAPFGAAGTVITGGGHPVPIGPQEFARLWRRLTPPEKEAYIGLAIRNLGRLLTDQASRDEVERVTTQLMESDAQEETR